MLLHTTIEKRRSRAFKRYKVYQNLTIIKEVRSKNVILLPQCPAGAGSARAGSIGFGSTGAGSTGAGSARAGSTGAGPGAGSSRAGSTGAEPGAGSTGAGPRSGPVQPPGPDLSNPRVRTCPTPGSGPVQPPGPDLSNPRGRICWGRTPGPDPSASTSRKKTFLLITSLIMVRF